MGCRVRLPHFLSILGILLLTVVSCVMYFCSSTNSLHSQLRPVNKSENLTKPVDEARKSDVKIGGEAINISTEEVKPTTALIQGEKPTWPQDSVKIPSKGENKLSVDQRRLTRNLYPSGHNLTSPERCPKLGMKLRLLIVVVSAPDHSKARMAIRQTWGSIGQRTDVALAFCVGLISQPKVAAAVSEEEDLYRDIIQGHFIDSYRNLTLKTLSILEWTNKYCPLTKFVLKVDDDTFVNTPELLQFIDKNNESQRTIFGRLRVQAYPIRDRIYKYYVSVSEFSGSVYPDYMLGPAYLITGDVIRELYSLAMDTPFLSMEDVLITGILAQALNIKQVHVNRFLRYKTESLGVCDLKQIISASDVQYYEQYYGWTTILNGSIKC